MSTVKEWRETRLKNLFTSVRNGVWGTDPDDETEVFCARGTDFDRTANRISVAKMPRRSVPVGALRDHQLQHGDLVLEKSGGSADQPVGSVALFDLEIRAVCSNFNARMQVSRDVDPPFACYLMNSLYWSGFTRQFVQQTTGIQNLDAQALLAQHCTLPPLDEQRHIADFLDAETARIGAIESAIGSAQQVLAERFASELRKAFEGNPSEMKSCQLRRVVKKWIDYRGATPGKTIAGIPLVTARNIIDGLIDLDASPEFIDEVEYGSWMVRGLPRLGDVLLTTEAPLGQVAMITDPAIAVAQRIILLRVDESALSQEWLYWYLQSPQGQFELSSRATGSTALGIKADRLRAVPIPVCEPSLMRERLKMIGELDSQFKMLRQPMMCQLAVLAERRQALITAAVTGQIDVTTARGVSLSGGVAV